MLRKPFSNQRANLLLWVILVSATIALVTFLLANSGSRVGPPYQSISIGTATPQPTATPGFTFDGEVGRPVSSGGTTYLTIPGVPLQAAGGDSSIGTVGLYYPIQVLEDMEFDQMGIDVGVASGTGGSVARLCVFNSDQDLQPLSLVYDAGTVATDSTGIKLITHSAQSLSAGSYLLWMGSDANFRARVFNGSPGLAYGGLQTTAPVRMVTDFRYGFPASTQAVNGCANPGTAWGSISTGSTSHGYHVFMRISTP